MTVPRINGRSGRSIIDFLKSHRSWLLAAVFASFLITGWSQAQEGRRLRAGYTSLSGNMLPLWAARDGGYFKKYGLDFDLISMPSGNEGMSALIAGELEFLAIAGSTTASAAIGAPMSLLLARPWNVWWHSWWSHLRYRNLRSLRANRLASADSERRSIRAQGWRFNITALSPSRMSPSSKSALCLRF